MNSDRNETNEIILDNFLAIFPSWLLKLQIHMHVVKKSYNGQKQSSLIVTIIEYQIS